MNCDREKLYLYLERALSPSESAEVSAHLQTCPACAAELGSQQAVMDELDRLADVPLPQWLPERIIQRVSEDVTLAWQTKAERRRALVVAVGLTVITCALLSLPTLAGYLRTAWAGLHLAGRLVWDLIAVSLKAVSLVTIGLLHDVAGETELIVLLALLTGVIISLIVAHRTWPSSASLEKR